MKYYYSDKKTQTFLNTTKKRVYLYGSSAGYTNFGDIIQLKGVVNYYKTRTDIEPVIIFRLNSIEGPNYVKQLNRWYGCEYIVFLWDELVDASEVGLSILKTLRGGGILHLYGGGFLNEYWGEAVVKNVIDLLKSFNLSEYVVSGQQVEPAFIPFLNEKLFKFKKPLLFGLRDEYSYQSMQEKAIINTTRFSFDDVIEIFLDWKRLSGTSLKVKALNKLRTPAVAIHLNISYYSSNRWKVLSQLRKIKSTFPQYRPIILQAFNDLRHATSDSLQSIIRLENNFPYQEYRVVDFAQLALNLNAEKAVYPNVTETLSSVKFGVSSSYHIAMLLTILGKPTYLTSNNDFYSQKQKALGLEPDFEIFLNKLPIQDNPYSVEISKRKDWLHELSDVIIRTQKNIKYKPIELPIGRRKLDNLPKLNYKRPNS